MDRSFELLLLIKPILYLNYPICKWVENKIDVTQITLQIISHPSVVIVDVSIQLNCTNDADVHPVLLRTRPARTNDHPTNHRHFEPTATVLAKHYNPLCNDLINAHLSCLSELKVNIAGCLLLVKIKIS